MILNRNKQIINNWIESFKLHFNRYENLIILMGLVIAYMFGVVLGKIL